MVTTILRPPVIALTAFAGFTWLLAAGKPSTGTAPLSAPLPPIVGSWTGTPVAVSQQTVAILETDDVALMEYRLDPAPPVWVAQVAGFGNRAAFHPPELCYVGSHFEVLERGVIVVPAQGQDRTLMRLVVGQQGHRFEAWYWFTANGRVTPNYYQQQLWLLTDAIQRKPISGTLMRLSTLLDDPAASHQRLLDFFTTFAASPLPDTPS